jgi:hypothetical protein
MGRPSGAALPRQPGWWSRAVAFVRRGYAAAEASLAAYYRLCHLAEPVAPAVSPRTVSLRDQEVLSITRRQAARLEVQRGIVWLTATPAAGDVILHAGDQFEISDASPYVVQALGEATILLRGR